MEKSKKGGGARPLSDETFEILQQKCSNVCKALDKLLLKETPQEVHPVIIESMNSEMVKDAIKRTRRAAGPSGINTGRWRCILI